MTSLFEFFTGVIGKLFFAASLPDGMRQFQTSFRRTAFLRGRALQVRPRCAFPP
jgi:hypothetical protein